MATEVNSAYHVCLVIIIRYQHFFVKAMVESLSCSPIKKYVTRKKNSDYYQPVLPVTLRLHVAVFWVTGKLSLGEVNF